MSTNRRVLLALTTTIVAPVVLAFLTGFPLLSLVRDQLKYGCGYYTGGGGPGGYVCNDGIGYIGVGVFVYGCLGLLGLIAAAKSAQLAERPKARRRVLMLLALLPLALLVLTTIGVKPQPAEPGVDLWAQHMAVATWLAAASAVMIVAAALVARGTSATFIIGALALLAATTVAQFGTLYATLPAALLLGWAWWADHRSHRAHNPLAIGSAA